MADASTRAARQEETTDVDDDGAPTEMWHRPEDLEAVRSLRAAFARSDVDTVVLHPTDDEPTPGASVAPVALDREPLPVFSLAPPPPPASARTYALGALVIGAAACVGLAFGLFARQVDLAPAATRTTPAVTLAHAPAASVVTPSPVEAPPSPARVAPVTIDSLPSVEATAKVVKVTSVATTAVAGEFDRAAATAAIARCAAIAAGCDGAPEGALALVTFAPSGRVALVSGEAVSARGGACVAAAFRGASMHNLKPGARVVSVAMQEVQRSAQDEKWPYDFVWFTPRVDENDPCAGM